MNLVRAEPRELNIKVPNPSLSSQSHLNTSDEEQAKQQTEAARTESERIRREIESLEKLVAGLSAQQETLDYELTSIRAQIATSWKATNANNRKVFKHLVEAHCVERNHHLKMTTLQRKLQVVSASYTLLQDALHYKIIQRSDVDEWVAHQRLVLDDAIRRMSAKEDEWLKMDYRGLLASNEQDMLGSMSLLSQAAAPPPSRDSLHRQSASSTNNSSFQDLLKTYQLMEHEVKQLQEEALHLEVAIQEQEFAKLTNDVDNARMNLG
ncbi:hypothetical protein SeMB42_g01685 [Synchytrium endobioticum]|uniref:Uncharacterized protein n=1 Tax=Synchytrium endobioticum TaxID=286115 RepID=A0A507DKJ1_9FUNG|nr:hypothetical protein SeLEV6574_g03753 [Synchytrium endobioticum]TPX52046.1 hypothetical protein SeMB42_g01685 [Synchytrium endobioticum]